VIDTGCNAHHEGPHQGIARFWRRGCWCASFPDSLTLSLPRSTPGKDLVGRTNVVSSRYPSGDDDHGHGTHVAGIAAGKSSGVCKKCQVVCIKAMNKHGSGAASDIIDAIEYVIAEHSWLPKNSPAVVVMSVGMLGSSDMFDQAMESLSAEGIVPVVAAANYNTDACLYTPGRSPYAVTVGATELTDALYSYSNYGGCVNVLAPGHGISSASYRSNTTFEVRDGTSQAAPAVGGAIALVLAEKYTSQAEALRLVVLNSKRITYKKHDGTWTQPILRVNQDSCSSYNFTGELLRLHQATAVRIARGRRAATLVLPHFERSTHVSLHFSLRQVPTTTSTKTTSTTRPTTHPPTATMVPEKRACARVNFCLVPCLPPV
jgi:subtilisin family serine protease